MKQKKSNDKGRTMRFDRPICIGFVVGLITLATCTILGFDIEQSSYLQLNNFNEAADGGCQMVLSMLRWCGNAHCDELQDALIKKYKMDSASGCGWSVPMRCKLFDHSDAWSVDESGQVVMLFMWRDDPFGVFVIGKDRLPRISIVR